MSLRKQLAVFSLLTLVLPWAGYRYVREMEAVLRDGLEQSLIERAQTVAGALDRQSFTAELGGDTAAAAPATVYARMLAAAPEIDGSRADWSIAAALGTPLSSAVHYWAGVHGASLYLAVAVADDSVVYQARPAEPPYGDRLVVFVGGERPLWRVLATAAPGRVRAQQTAPPLLAASGSYDDRIEAAWLATREGYSVEMRLPLGILGETLGLAVVDVDVPAADAASSGAATAGYRVELIAGWDTAGTRAAPLVRQSALLRSALEQFADSANRYTIIGADGWIRAAAGRIDGAGGQAGGRSLTGDLLRYLLQTEDPDAAGVESPAGRVVDAQLSAAIGGDSVVKWFRGDIDNSARVIAGVPLRYEGTVVGALLLEQASETVLTATNQAVLRLLSTTFAASVLALLGMLGFATYLSVRVSRLARAAGGALGPRGQIDTRLPGRAAADEIGALARSFERLLERLNEYTSYLRTLTSKLSHELRTPLAVVSTSLDNLEHARDGDAALYLRRLRDGANRLDTILGAMSEATRMEQAIADTTPTQFDAVALVRACASAYADIYREHRIVCTGVATPVTISGSAELLAQLLDKLVDNAASFSVAGTAIEISLARGTGTLELAVSNEGPPLPPQMREQLFDSLVSVREPAGGRPHLGLGLYVARLIAEFHGGSIAAASLPDDKGAVFTVSLPISSQPRSRA